MPLTLISPPHFPPGRLLALPPFLLQHTHPSCAPQVDEVVGRLSQLRGEVPGLLSAAMQQQLEALRPALEESDTLGHPGETPGVWECVAGK
jgi:hypothetical protein